MCVSHVKESACKPACCDTDVHVTSQTLKTNASTQTLADAYLRHSLHVFHAHVAAGGGLVAEALVRRQCRPLKQLQLSLQGEVQAAHTPNTHVLNTCLLACLLVLGLPTQSSGCSLTLYVATRWHDCCEHCFQHRSRTSLKGRLSASSSAYRPLLISSLEKPTCGCRVFSQRHSSRHILLNTPVGMTHLPLHQ